MALADRYYMREEYHPPWMTTRLIIVLIVAFFIQSALFVYQDVEVNRHFALSLNGLLHGKIWQLLTFQFLHSVPWPWHVLFNCLGLYFVGRQVEQLVGARKFLGLYLMSGVAGGILQALLSLIPRHEDIPVVGASAGVCGLIAIFCSLRPMEEIRMYFLPITIRAHWFLTFLTLFSLYGAVVPYDAVANGAHLGGILFGIAYVRSRRSFWDNLFERFHFPWRKQTNSSTFGTSAKNAPWKRNRATTEPKSTTFISKEVDPILDKISAQGLDSLTDEERKVLEAARKFMR